MEEELWQILNVEQDIDVIVINRVEVSAKIRRLSLKVSDFYKVGILGEDEGELIILNKSIEQMLKKGKTSEIVKLGDVTFVIDIIRRGRSIIIFGAGHVGRSLALLGAMCGFDIFLVDDRASFLIPEKIPDRRIKGYCLDFNEAFDHLEPGINTGIVIVTRGHQYDMVCLRQAIKTDARYIGMIGSRRRVMSILNSLKELGLSSEELLKLDGVHAPIGLEIGARLPEEIAVSILAQVIKVMNVN